MVIKKHSVDYVESTCPFFHEEGFQLPEASKCRGTVENVHIHSCVRKTIHHIKTNRIILMCYVSVSKILALIWSTMMISCMNKVWTTFRALHDDVIKWKHFLRNWPFVRGIHRSPVNSKHKGQWRGALMFALICVWIKQSWGWRFETQSYSLWRHSNGLFTLYMVFPGDYSEAHSD